MLPNQRQDGVDACLARVPFLIQNNHNPLKADREFMATAIESNYRVLKYADDALKADREFMATAIELNYRVLKYADEVLKADREFVMIAAAKNLKSLYYAHRSLLKDKAFILSIAINLDDRVLLLIDDDLKQDIDFIMLCLQEKSDLLYYVDSNWRKNKKIVLAAVEYQGKLLQIAAPELQEDREVVLTAVKQSGQALQHASKVLKNDRKIVEAAIRQDSYALIYSDKFLKDEEMALMAVCSDPSFLAIVPKFGENENFILRAIVQNGLVLKYTSKDCRRNIHTINIAVRQNPFALQYVDKKVITIEIIKEMGFAVNKGIALKDLMKKPNEEMLEQLRQSSYNGAKWLHYDIVFLQICFNLDSMLIKACDDDTAPLLWKLLKRLLSIKELNLLTLSCKWYYFKTVLKDVGISGYN